MDFDGNDQIDLVNFVVDPNDPDTIEWIDNGVVGDNTGGTLTITDVTGATAVITFADGDYVEANFKLASDGNGGTLLSDPPASTTTSDATVIPVVDTSTVTATETASSQTDVSSATVDDGTFVPLNTAVSDPDGGETTSMAINGNEVVADTTGTVSESRSLMVNSGAALEFTSISHRVAGILTDHGTVQVTTGSWKLQASRLPSLRRRCRENAVPLPPSKDKLRSHPSLLCVEYLTDHFKLASDADAGTLIADPPASPDATVAAVADTRTVKAADTADTQATPTAVEDGTVAAFDAAMTPDGGMSDLTISSLPADFVLPESEGDEPTVAHDTISLAYSEFTDLGVHGSSKDYATTLNIAVANSAEGRAAAKASVSLSSHPTSWETGSDGNSNGGNAARIHDAIAGHSSTIDTVGTTISDSISSTFPGATSGHLNDQPHFENASPGTLQSQESPTQAALHADEGRADHSHSAAAEHSPTIDPPATAIADSGAPGLRGEPPGHANDQPQLGNANPGNNGLGHQSRELPSQASSHATKDTPSVTAVEDANKGHAAHSHGAAAEHSSTIDTPATTIADSGAQSLRGEPPGHANDQPHFGNANAGNNGLGHQSRELPSQVVAHTAVENPQAAAGEHDNGGHARHIHGAAAEHSSKIETAEATVAGDDSSSFRGAASEHGNDQPHFGNANAGNNGLGHQPRELPSQAASHAAVEIPLDTADNSAISLPNDFNSPALPTAAENGNGAYAGHIHSTAAEHASTIDADGETAAHSDDSSTFRGAASEHVTDQFHFRYTNSSPLQSLESPSHAALPGSGEIPLPTANPGAVNLSNSFNSPSPPLGADNSQAAEDPSLPSGTVSRGLAVTNAGVDGNGNDPFQFDPKFGHDNIAEPHSPTDKIHPAHATFQIVDDILTDAAHAAALDAVTTAGQTHGGAWTNARDDKPSNDFILHP